MCLWPMILNLSANLHLVRLISPTWAFPSFAIFAFFALSQAGLPPSLGSQAGTPSCGSSSTTGLAAAAPGCPGTPRAIHWNWWNCCQGYSGFRINENLDNSCHRIFEYLCLIPDRKQDLKKSKNEFLWQAPPHTTDCNYSRVTKVTRNLEINWDNNMILNETPIAENSNKGHHLTDIGHLSRHSLRYTSFHHFPSGITICIIHDPFVKKSKVTMQSRIG